jgi:hypothetical protein
MFLEPRLGFEPKTPSLPWKCSTTELSRRTCNILQARMPKNKLNC